MATVSNSSRKPVEGLINAVFGSPWLWGTAITCVFYASLPYLPFFQQDMQRYFTAHWIEYATTGLFAIGICTLLGKLKQVPAERSAFKTIVLGGSETELARDSVEIASQLDAQVGRLPKPYQDTSLVKRVREACSYVSSRRSAEGLEGHLTYLAELNSGRLHDGYALIRTITWAVPILGFLGTVIGITMAIANITPDKLEASLPEVTAGLAVAFDTTALSLALSMILVFGTFLIERAEQRVLDDVEDFGVKHLLPKFPTESNEKPASPLTEAEQQAANQLLLRSEGMINWQMELWQSSLETLRERWSGTLSKQQECLDQALQSGLTNALVDHSQQLAEARSEFMTAFQSTSQIIAEQLAETRTALAEQQVQSQEQIAQTWQQFRAEIAQTRDEHARQLALLIQAVTAEVGGWQNQLETSVKAMAQQFGELRSQGEVFLKITENESELVRLEHRLSENLDAVRVAESLEHTLLNLNAAVNLLTTRTKSKAA